MILITIPKYHLPIMAIIKVYLPFKVSGFEPFSPYQVIVSFLKKIL